MRQTYTVVNGGQKESRVDRDQRSGGFEQERDMEKLVNLTRHPLTVMVPGAVVVVPSSGIEAEAFCALDPDEAVFYQGVEIPISVRRYRGVRNLPEPRSGTIFIVPRMVVEAVPSRTDLVSPGRLIRDAHGNVVACSGLERADLN